ncbi:Dabb family protein [Aquimarina sp. 2201CG5-10]|uniref:Dabb family protein n=1 Tax=Aquimarina callyspongiae TaxID=3098150 RepID=UPI002AB3E7E0|nr:Dabb family protein [Aquimarina sp. 2201CG5-10]MDY8135857.1 Dabb family protein [Aquimarina sp. 2201CG5-10]
MIFIEKINCRPLFYFLSVTLLISCQPNSEGKEFDENFVHSVYVWLKEPNNPKDRAMFEKSLDKLFKTSKYTKTNFLGIPANTQRSVVDNSYTYAIIVTFSSKEEQDLYQTEEAHLLFIEEASSLWNKVQIYDTVTNDF